MKKTLFSLIFCLLIAGNFAHSIDRPIRLSDLSFLEGHWVSPEGSTFYEEVWLAPYQGVMSGTFRWPSAGGSDRYVLELLTFVENESGVTFFFKHFDPDLDAWEQTANTYRVVEASEDCARLELANENSRVPQVIRYCLLDESILEFRGADAETPIEESDFVLRFERRAQANRPAYPLLDGDCSEYASLAQQTLQIAPGVELQVFQDSDYVWFCYGYPEGSYGALDLIVDAPGIEEPLNLHVSAQLGEWPAARPDEAPQEENSDLWWVVSGWWANSVSINGRRETDDGWQFKYRPTPGRELQISKERFGRGVWHLKFDISLIRSADGFVSVHFPEKDGEDRASWALDVR